MVTDEFAVRTPATQAGYPAPRARPVPRPSGAGWAPGDGCVPGAGCAPDGAGVPPGAGAAGWAGTEARDGLPGRSHCAAAPRSRRLRRPRAAPAGRGDGPPRGDGQRLIMPAALSFGNTESPSVVFNWMASAIRDGNCSRLACTSVLRRTNSRYNAHVIAPAIRHAVSKRPSGRSPHASPNATSGSPLTFRERRVTGPTAASPELTDAPLGQLCPGASACSLECRATVSGPLTCWNAKSS